MNTTCLNQRLSLAAALLCLASAAFAGSSTNSQLVTALAQHDASLAEIPFHQLIEITTQCRVLTFDTNNAIHIELQRKLLEAAALAGQQALRQSLNTENPDSSGPDMHSLVQAALIANGLEVRSAGDAETDGYPDLEIIGDAPCYLEIQTYSAATAHSTRPSLHCSPPFQSRITHDAFHFLLAYQMEKVTQDNKNTFVPIRWKLISLQDVALDAKCEFTQSNRNLFGPAAAKSLIAENEVR